MFIHETTTDTTIKSDEITIVDAPSGSSYLFSISQSSIALLCFSTQSIFFSTVEV